MNFTLIDFLLIVGELAVLAIAFLILIWIVRIFFKRLQLLPGLRSHQQLLASGQRSIFRFLALLWAVLSLFLVAVNAIVLWQKRELLPSTLGLFKGMPSRIWVDLGGSVLQSAIVLAVAAAIQKPLSNLLNWVSKSLQNWDRFPKNDVSIDNFFQALKLHASNGIWLAALLLCSQSFQLETISQYLFTLLKIYLTIAIGLLILKSPDPIIDTLDAWSEEYLSRNTALQSYSQLRNLVPFLKRCLEYAIAIGIATLALAQVEFATGFSELGVRGIRILGIILAGRVLIEFSTLFVSEFLIGKQPLAEEQYKRRMTLVPIAQSFLKYGIYVWIGILILETIAVDPTPILAAAGVVGLAVGLGAQNLINDTVSGFFILFENYYLVGDYIQVEDAEGVVEAIELRTTRIRHPNGQLQIIRNGDINSITNFSREYVYAVVDVGVAYDSDLNLVYRTIEEVGIEIQNLFPQDVLNPTEVDGLEAFEDYKLIVRAVTKLKPNNSRRGVHDDIQGELRKLIKEAFEREGIVMPVPKAIGVISDSDEN